MASQSLSTTGDNGKTAAEQRQDLLDNDVQDLWAALTSSEKKSEGQLERLKGLQESIVRELESGGGGIIVHLAEGRANVVYKIVNEEVKDPSDTEEVRAFYGGKFAGCLIRVPKATPGVTPHSYERLQEFRENIVEPAVGPQFLVPQVLYRISEEQAKDLNLKRDPQGDDKSHIEAGHAFLIQDLTPRADQIGLEFKPKWLTQSPIAPADSTRCRTCAREAYRNSQKLKQGKKISTPICPLGLLHSDSATVVETVKRLTPGWNENEQLRLKEAFDTTQILIKLRDIQVQGDPGNNMFTHPEGPGFGLAMTLRDCTCFVRMSKDPNDKTVEIKLADVDEKNWVSKQMYWQESHTNLVDHGFYHGTEQPAMETHCLLNADSI